jgi:hypothetical protein
MSEKRGQVFLLDSVGGQVAKVNSAALLAGMAGPAEYHAIHKAMTEPAATSEGSKRLREKYGTTLDGVTCAIRPFDFSLFAYAASLNTYHMRAIRAKTKDIVGRAWKISGDGQEAARKKIETFFRSAFGLLTFGEGMGNVWTDYEALGNGYLEVVPTVKGDEPAEMAHIPAPEMWIRLDDLGFVQQKNGLYQHFRRWGVDPKRFDELPESDPLRADDVTSVCHFSRYFPWSLSYGIPCIMPAWSALSLAVLQAEFNLGFFNNNAIPDYAVILEGDWEEDAEQTIQEYFRTHLKGQAHKTLAMRSPTNGKITFEQLTSDNAKEGSFRLLRSDCRDEILHAHGVPPQKVGIIETGRLGGNKANEQIVEYKISIVDPGREKVTARLNRLIAAGFGSDKFRLEFEPYNIDDLAQQATIDATYLDRDVLAPNEVRRVRFPDLAPLPGGDAVLARGGGSPVEDAMGAVQKAIRAAAMEAHLL